MAMAQRKVLNDLFSLFFQGPRLSMFSKERSNLAVALEALRGEGGDKVIPTMKVMVLPFHSILEAR